MSKGNRDFRSIGLIEVLWKKVSRLINHQITLEISYHDILNGFT